ncbi:hypothetical protein BDW02DRAFT_304236 [Decorospora gaudefroyi]|uniref:Zn(2)-C6 fungal-type domain-containing protein n=1 Tax=Decorospora gaudefroyi TaxID=184978 RepID=A0A6A5KYL2_9PLEO|nr:hypothetical protein BDW02DRAFT_304236 [Decorospora gaudefroyi]
MMDIMPSNTPHHTSYHTPRSAQNPYARIPSRRAIACVTCAKAKTKCDKALPSCSRCIAKGIKCDPRSTRRTSDNRYRANIKKPLAPPRQYHATGNMSQSIRHSSPRNMPSLNTHGIVSATSPIDLQDAEKMSQHAPGLSGYPMLTPLPTYVSPITDESYSYSSSPDQNLDCLAQTMEMSSFPNSGRHSPRTPEPIVHHEPISVADSTNHYMMAQPWSDERLAPFELELDPSMADMLSIDLWTTHDTTSLIPLHQDPWPQAEFSLSPQQISMELTSQISTVAHLATSEYPIENYSSDTMQEEWSIYQPFVTDMTLVSPAPLMHDLNLLPSHMPIWQDAFVPESSSY